MEGLQYEMFRVLISLTPGATKTIRNNIWSSVFCNKELGQKIADATDLPKKFDTVRKKVQEDFKPRYDFGFKALPLKIGDPMIEERNQASPACMYNNTN